MPRVYKRKVDARKYKNYTEETLQQAVNALMNSSFRKVSKKFDIPVKTLQNKVSKRHSKSVGGQKRLSKEIELLIAKNLTTLTEWKTPLDSWDIRYIVKGYLDLRNVKDKKFKNNLPGPDWVRAFMKRNNLTERVADNVKRSRAEVDRKAVGDYFDNLEKELEGIDPQNIFNYDETNVTDDPGAKKVIVRRGLRRVERVIDHSKQAFSVMFAGNAVGEYLPPMVVYKAKNVYLNWEMGGPVGAVYDNTKSGWFDMRTFEVWFKELFLPCVAGKPGPKVIIGDNLGSHFSPDVLRLTEEHDIRFITLIPNSTHLLQPLDVAVFRTLKVNWRRILDQWKKESRHKGTIPKTTFPSLLKQLCQTLSPDHLISGFKATGISPCNREPVLEKLPDADKDPGGDGSAVALSHSVMAVLQERCGIGEEKQPRKKRGPKVQAGKRIMASDIPTEEEKAAKKRKTAAKKKTTTTGKKKAPAKNAADDDVVEDGQQPSTSGYQQPVRENPKRAARGSGRQALMLKAMMECEDVESETEEEIFLDSEENDEDEWVCDYCAVRWDEEGTDRWVVCDVCDGKYHLQCSGIDYIQEDYYDINLIQYRFLCDSCRG